MKMFTRSITKYAAIAYAEKWENGIGRRVEVGRAEYVAASTTPTEARAALKAAGIAVKRGMHVEIVELEQTLYGMSVEDFMRYAQPIESKKLDEEVTE